MSREAPERDDERSSADGSAVTSGIFVREFIDSGPDAANSEGRARYRPAGTNMLRANLAVMSILRSEGLRAEGSMQVVALRSRWGRYALRARDLDISLQNLSALGLIDVGTLRGRQHVILTEEGDRWIYSLMGFVASLLTWPRRIACRLAKLRHPPAPVDQRRRSSDRCGASSERP